MTAESWLSEDEQNAWRSFVAMRHRLERTLERHLQREFGLSASDFEVLVNLSESPGGRMRAVELGRATQWEKSRMSHHLSRMAKRGLIRRVAGDARYPEIELTGAGRDAITAGAPANAARVRKLFIDVLGPERLALIGAASEDVLVAIEADQSAD